ncbi:MAG: pantoate--beta-alanine ligase, partial [Deltaproteobacteria bacterium]|nr:pantoate--beta-alanine ligase [Deltaproteobacteria bacterium]
GYDTYVSVEGLSKNLCGIGRPGHFRGAATVVLKLFNIVEPHTAVFGKKDFQQFAVIKRMVKDLDLDIEIEGVETVRDANGLAFSSRNACLTPEERAAANCIPASLNAGKLAFLTGVRESGKIIRRMKNIMDSEPRAVIEYIKICDPATLADIDRIDGAALAAVAVRIGKTRLIDNIELYP